MEGPEIQGPPVWLDLNRRSEAKILDFITKINDRNKWLDQFVEECKLKLGVESTDQPTFVPKTPGKGRKKRGGRKSKLISQDETVTEEKVPVSADVTITEPRSTRTRRGKAAADVSTIEADTTVDETARRLTRARRGKASADDSVIDAQPVPKPRASKRNVTVVSSGSEPDQEEPSVKKSSVNDDTVNVEEIVTEVVNSTVIVSTDPDTTFEVTSDQTTNLEDQVFIEAESVSKPSANEVVRSLLDNQLPSPIAAPRRSFRNIQAEEASNDEPVAKKKSLLPYTDVNEDNQEEVSPVTDVTVTVNTTNDKAEDVVAVDQSPKEAEVPDVNSEEECITADEEEPTVEVSQVSVESSAEKPKSAEKISSSEKTITITKDDDESDGGRSRRTTRTKASLPPEPEVVEARRVTRSKIKEPSAAVTEDVPKTRVTRSKAPKPKSDEESVEPVRSTRTFTKAASSSALTKAAASPRVRELAARALSPTKHVTPPRSQVNVGYTGSPIRDRVKQFETAMKESAGLRSTSSEDDEVDNVPKTPVATYFTPKRKSSIANSLRKVSAARKMTVNQVVVEQDVNVVSPPKKGPVIRKSPGNKPKANLNNSRAPAGKIVKPGKKVMASGGRGVSPATGPRSGGAMSTGGSTGGTLIRSRSRMNLIEKAGKTTPGGNGPSNLRTGVTSFLPQKPKGPTLEEIQAKKDEERKQKEQRELEARQRREEALKSKAEEAKRVREERIRRVKEAREKKENQAAKKLEEKETQEKLAVLRKKEEQHKEAERKKKEAERKEAEERHQREEEERLANEKRLEQLKKEEELKKLRLLKEKRLEEEKRRQEEKKAAEKLEKERIMREQEELRKMREREALRNQADLNNTYNKPADATFNKTIDKTVNVGPSSYDITPARCELPPPPPQTEENYGVADLKSDTDTDDEDNPKKQVPKWAEGTKLRTALVKQCYMGPDVDKIFFRVQDPDLSVMFNQQKKRYFKRTSSACWDSAPQSFNFKR